MAPNKGNPISLENYQHIEDPSYTRKETREPMVFVSRNVLHNRHHLHPVVGIPCMFESEGKKKDFQ